MPEHNDNTIAHMNMIQGVITRLETNCFTHQGDGHDDSGSLVGFLGRD